MNTQQEHFIRFAIESNVLQFGEFTLKSGRISPYFYNSALFNSGAKLAQLADHYALAIIASGIEFDMIFGPAYKGIPLVSTVATSLYRIHGVDIPWAFNRKEAKDHGEGGIIVGAPLEGNVLIIDDVITAGTAIREVIPMIEKAGATANGVCVSLDRQEVGDTDLTAIEQLEDDFNLEASINIAGFTDIIKYANNDTIVQDHLDSLTSYRKQYGA